MENNPAAAPEKPIEKSGAAKRFSLKIDKRMALIAVIVLTVLGALFYFKDLFIAATVDGMPISRWSVVRELEKNSGQQALDVIITKKLIEAEVTRQGISISQADIDEEIRTIEQQISKQGGTLEMALTQQGITQEQFQEQLALQKKLEKILADKIQVTDEEVNQYLTQSKAPLPAGVSEEDFKNQIRDQLKNQKFNAEADKWITGIKGSAKIQYFVDYGKPAPAPAPAPAPMSSSSQGQ